MMMNGAGFPFIDLSSGGNALNLVRSLDQAIALTNADTVIIPGHGPLASKDDLIAWRGMIATSIDRVRSLKEAGRTLEDAKAARPLAGLSSNPAGFVPEDAFVEAIWRSLEAGRS
jgi:glyoxylase-like metal-dependent hydrolase (beta-lactamase superfamily II)